MNAVVDLINEIEWVRKQIDDLERMLDGGEKAKEVPEAGEALDEKLRALEGRFFDVRLTGGSARQDDLWWPRRLYTKLISLAGYIGGSDFVPTAQELEVLDLYRKELADCQSQMNELRSKDIATFNQLLRDKGISTVVSGIW